jgi:signal transduction histidine kinase
MGLTAGSRREEVPGWVLTVLAAVGQAVVVALIIAIGSVDAGPPGYGAYLFAAGFGAILLLQHRFAVAVLIVSVLGIFAYYALDYPPIGMAVPVAGAFYRCAERGRTVIALGTGLVLLGVSLFFRVGDGESSAVLAYDVITNAALIGAAIALAQTVRSTRALRRQQEQLVALERAHQQERSARQLQAERVRIARDVHDSIGHALSLVSVQARVGQQSLGADDDAVSRALDSVVKATGSSLTDLRRTLVMLQSDGDAASHADHGPVSLQGIERTAQAARDAGLDVDLDLDVDAAISAVVGSTAYRIVQESVTNVLRHAGASAVRITVGAEGDELHVRVADNGRGADGRGEHGTGTTDRGRGIEGMRERAALLGGEVTVASTPSGFTVEAVLPIGGAR